MLTLKDPRSPHFYTTQGDTIRQFEAQLTDCSGAAVDLTDATVLLVRRQFGALASEGFECAIADAKAGKVALIWPEGSTDVPGDYQIQLVANWDGRTDSYPTGSYPYLLMRITPRL